MENFERVLYEAVLVAFGKIMSKYNTFAQGSVLNDVGMEIIQYLNARGLGFEEQGNVEDLSRLTELFVENGFAEKLEIEPAEVGQNFIWHNLFGIDAYRELHEISDNPFLACPLNLCLYYIARKHNKSFKLHKKSFEPGSTVVESQYEIIDQENFNEQPFDSLVIENARLYEIATERAEKLKKAYNEIKTLRGIIPICSSCKKIRDDEGYWQQVEVYVRDRTDADFSHGICPGCYDQAIKELEEE